MFDELQEYEHNGHHNKHEDISAAGMQSGDGFHHRTPYENSPADVPPSPAGNEALNTSKKGEMPPGFEDSINQRPDYKPVKKH